MKRVRLIGLPLLIDLLGSFGQFDSCSVSNGFSLKLFEVAEEEFLFQAIKSPTRFREGKNASLLDLAFTKYPHDVSSVQMLSELVESATIVNWQHISSLESVTDMWLTLRVDPGSEK